MTSQDLRRLAIAFACSIAIHEAAAALIPSAFPARPAPREIVAHVTIVRIERRPRPTPTPAPTPTPTPPPRRVVHAVIPTGKHARVERIKRAGAHRPTPPKSQLATPDVIPVPTAGEGAGAQQGSGAGSTSSVNGSGNGTGDQGSGSGAGICGAVDFESTGPATLDPASGMYERTNVIATVYYPDGSFRRIPLNWTWQWKSEADDPFNADSDAPMLFQFPPLAQRAGEPPVVQYIMAHTTPGGHTMLNDRCPNIPPPLPEPTALRGATAAAAPPAPGG